MKEELTVQLASIPDQEDLVAELWIGTYQLSELHKGDGKIILEIYPNPNGKPWSLDLDDLIDKLLLAKSKLI